MIPLEDALGESLRRMGLAEPALMLDLNREWASLVGEPWATQTVPLYLKGGVLVVETAERASVSMLRYGVADLRRKLAERFGESVVTDVEIRPPQRPGRGV